MSQAALLTAIAAICLVWMMSPALAQASPPPFTPTDAWQLFGTDYGDSFTSVFLNQIFGPLFPSAAGANVDTVFGRLIGYFNVIVLIIGGLMFFWNITIAIMQTAHEGSVLGQRYSSLWVPLRLIAAVGMLVPVPGLNGYNLAQSGVAYNVKAATSTASFFWGKTAELVIQDDVAISTTSPAIPAAVVQGVWENMVCERLTNDQMAIAGKAGGSPLNVIFMEETFADQLAKTTDPLDPNAAQNAVMNSIRDAGKLTMQSYLVNPATKALEKPGICGTFTSPDVPNYIKRVNPTVDTSLDFGVMKDQNTAIASDYIASHTQAVESLMRDFRVVVDANKVAIADETATLPVAQKEITAAIFKANEILAKGLEGVVDKTKKADAAGDRARDRMLKRITGSCSDATDAAKPGDTEKCYGEGWIGAGSWYMMLARLNNELSTLMTSHVKVSGPASYSPGALFEAAGGSSGWFSWWPSDEPGVDAGMLSQEEFTKQRNRYTEMFQESTIALAALGFSMSSDNLRELNEASGSDIFLAAIPTASWGFNRLMDVMISQTSPSSWSGDPMIGIIEIGNSLIIAAGILFAVQVVAGASFMGNTLIPPGSATAFQGPVTALIGAGVTLAFVIPMIPFVIWVMAVTGYFLLIVEAVIAVNLWALSHLRMDGEGISGEAGRQGWLMMLALFMTPSLMIFGYLVGMTLFRVTSTLVDVGLNQAITGVLGYGMFMSVMAIIMYSIMICAIYFAILERSFSLITELPDRVMKWMGANVSISADGGLAKKAIIGGVAGAAVAGSSSMKLGRGLGNGIRKLRENKNADIGKDQDGGKE